MYSRVGAQLRTRLFTSRAFEKKIRKEVTQKIPGCTRRTCCNFLLNNIYNYNITHVFYIIVLYYIIEWKITTNRCVACGLIFAGKLLRSSERNFEGIFFFRKNPRRHNAKVRLCISHSYVYMYRVSDNYHVTFRDSGRAETE